MPHPFFLAAAFVILATVCLGQAAAQTLPSTQPAPEPGSPEAIKLFILQKIVAKPFCFDGTQFPACDFEHPDVVEKLIGPYTLDTIYFDEAGQKVKEASKPGRYAAVVVIHRGDARVSRRFLTLFRIAKPARYLAVKPASPAVIEPMDWIKSASGASDEILDQYPEIKPMATRVGTNGLTTRPSAAIVLAGLHELTELARANKPAKVERLDDLDRQWWVNFKRTFYGYDALYPNPFVCPKPLEGAPATVVHDGTLADAGMKPDAVEHIDAACNAWVDQMKIGFNFCVVRHGVVVLNKGYGLEAVGPTPDAPYTPQTAGPLASTTKFLSSILLAEMVDQGLIDLDQPFEKYMPTMRDLGVKTPLTVREGYLHLGGFQDHWGDEMPDLEEVIGDLYPALTIGATFHYEGTSLALGGKIMENISGESIPQLYRKHLFDPLGCNDTKANLTSFGSQSTPMDLARIGQMALNGGAYGAMRFFTPATLQKMLPIPGKDRLDPKDNSIRWGVGIKQFDIDGFSEKALGHPGATGSCLVIDPDHDLVIAMTRFEEGGRFVDFLKKKSVVYKAVLDSIE